MKSLALQVSTPHGRAVPLEQFGTGKYGRTCNWFQPLMGEPSLWNGGAPVLKYELLEMVSTPHGRAVPLEPVAVLVVVQFPLVSTPHGRAVPLELLATSLM